MKPLLALALVASLLGGPALAADITLLVGFPPGQGADAETTPDAAAAVPGQRLTTEPTYEESGRFYAERLGAFLPGAPKVTMKLAPGAASLLAARRMLTAPGDGSVIALLGPRVALEPLMGAANAPWRPGDFAWIGARQRDDDVCVARGDAPARALDDLRRHELFAAALTPGSRGYLYARALNELGGAKLKIISGYGSEFEAARALDTGEANFWCGWSMNALRYRHDDLLRDGRVRPLVQFSTSPVPLGAGPPRASDWPERDMDREAMRAIESQTRFGAFALAAPPSTPPAVLATLRAGFLAMLRDPETRRLAGQRNMDVDPVPGEELAVLARDLEATSLAARERLRVVLRER